MTNKRGTVKLFTFSVEINAPNIISCAPKIFSCAPEISAVRRLNLIKESPLRFLLTLKRLHENNKLYKHV